MFLSVGTSKSPVTETGRHLNSNTSREMFREEHDDGITDS